MFKKSYQVIGVMSGTSLDGIDLAHIFLSIKDGKWQYEILECETVIYSIDWLNKLKLAVGFSEVELKQLNKDYTKLLAAVIKSFIAKNKITNLDAVCSHGHTILHQPQHGFTLQIGNLPEIASVIDQTIVCDFRVQDVELGGQGAPLVPIGDRLLFSDFDYCLNLGGFSNISFEQNGSRIAFDITPVNTVLNFYANQLGLEYDDKGSVSKSGMLNKDLLHKLNALDYYKKPFPKSLGIEYVNEIVLPTITQFDIPIKDKMRTFIEHIAIQTALALPDKRKKLFVTGGGAYNIYLIERLEFHSPQLKIIIPNKKTIEYKEALIFAFLGVLRLRNEINVLSSVTGAKKDHSSGVILN